MTSVPRQLTSDYFGRVNLLPLMGACYWLLMVITGTDLLNASLLTASIMFGLMSVSAAGGIKTAPGLLNFVLILKFVLAAVLLKALTWQPSDSNLRAPRTTCEVMAAGFFSLYLGSLIFRRSTKITGLVKDVREPRMYFWLTITFSIVSLCCAFIILLFQTSYNSTLTGGFWGVAHQFQGASAFCVVPAMYYAWSSGSKRFLCHPLVLVILFAELALGLAATTKQALMEPLLCYVAVGFIRNGLASKAVWGIVGGSVLLYLLIVYPYSEYVRNHGGRDGSLSERWGVIQEVFMNVARDAEYRQAVDSQITAGDTYLGKDSLEPISRLAMIGEADRLIAATDATQSYTGWETITTALRYAVPSFLMSEKPTIPVANFLGHVAGDLAPDDMLTQISYGFMANLYNAFGFYGVVLGTTLFISGFYYVIRLWFAAADLTFGPFGSTIWYVFLGMYFEHSLVESPIGYSFPVLFNISVIVALIFLAKSLTTFFGRSRAVARYA